jgi:diaminopimelate decarboxylase
MRNHPDTAQIIDGQLEIGGVKAIDLVKEFGTPLFVMDEQTIRNRCQDYLRSFKKYHQNTEIAYACKALCVSGILKIVTEEGLGLEVASVGEIFTAKKAGVDLSKVYFHCNNKPKSELVFAIDNKIGRIMVDNLQEVENLAAIGKPLDIILRINPGIEAHTHEYIKTATLDSKFGVPKDEIDTVVKAIHSKKNIRLKGFHAHIGSQIVDQKPFEDEVKLLLNLAKKYQVKELDLGGGIGIAYLEKDPVPQIEKIAEKIGSILKNDPDIKLILEPGRSIVGTAGVTLYTVGAIKDIRGIRKYLFIDGGMSDNPRPILYQAKYDAIIANRADRPKNDKVTIAGRFCESGDILIKDIKLQKAEVSDVLAVFCTGAYNYSMASNYNRVCRPAMICVNNGQAKLILRRESNEDLIKNDL